MILRSTAWQGHEVVVDGGGNDWVSVHIADEECGTKGIVVSPIHVELTQEEWEKLQEQARQSPRSPIHHSLFHRWTYDPVQSHPVPNPDWG